MSGVLVDSSIWIDHGRRADPRLMAWLRDGRVLGHPFVQGELACERMPRRDEVLALLDFLPRALVVDHADVLAVVDRHQLAGSGLGWVDLHLLASALFSQADLATRDQAMIRAARRLGVSIRE